jgi:superfamily II DNA or RNA helicase|tara:strand:+ start:463 stop:2094 length:1632 start_codon:yes stop_codon:yes gene_type:complete
MNLKVQLSKAGVNKLLELMGTNTTNLLQARGLTNFNSQNLAEVLIKLRGESDLLSDKRAQTILIHTLKPEEALELYAMCGISKKTSDPWEDLKKLKFKDKSKEKKTLFNFFKVKHEPRYVQKELQPNPENIYPLYGLFPYQITAINNIENYFKKPIKKAVLHMPTGSGKTRTAMSLITNFIKGRGEKDTAIVWLAHTEELCQQAYEEFKETWGKIGNRRITLYKLFKEHRHPVQKIADGMIIMSLDLAYSLTKNQQAHFFSLSRKTNFIVMDEAHMAVAPSYKQVLETLFTQKTCLLGLTATPGRSYLNPGEDIKLRDFFNKQKVSIKIKGYKTPIEYLQKKGFLAKTIYAPIESNLDINKMFTKREIESELKRIKNGQDVSKSFLKKISSNVNRTNIIIEQIKKESEDPQNKILVFASSVENAEAIHSVLFYDNINSACVTSNTNENLRRNHIENFKSLDSGLNILLNYGVLTTGFDAPKANIAIIGRPTQSVSLYSQMVGRVMRGPNVGGKKVCRIITVKDPIHGFRDMGESFNYWEDIWK